ncbi:MAG TPA: serine hydrolase domain-containing protein, partial [Cyclobacteriaceae bacterium]|nr:serine hydrolase domain-containing protein [Cyclobacteriaceae bacterium]
MRLLLFLLAIAIVSCTPVSKDQPLKAVRGTDNYLPPKFSDPERITKIKNAAPVVDAIYQNYARQNIFPSIAYGVIVDGQLVHSGASGEANLKTKRKSDIKTLYRIASMTKSFTAMAILKLRDEGKLNLQDPAAKYVSALDDITYLTSDAHRITIQDLLTMSAGFPEDNPWGDRQLSDTDQELIDL